MSSRSRTARRWLRLRRRVLNHGVPRVTLSAAMVAALSGVLISQAALWWISVPLASSSSTLLSLTVGLSSALLVTAAVWPLMRMLRELEAARVQLDVLATRDELTGIFNRRQFLVLADREWARCRRYDMGAALLMIDVDHFKRVNDSHGHLAGDLMLREIARAAGDTLRHADLLGRFGGEEFVIFLPHTDTLGALDVAERIRERVSNIALEWRGQVVRATLSVGVASLMPEHDTVGALVADADRALYTAKHAGRNCVRTPAALFSADPLGAALPRSSNNTR